MLSNVPQIKESEIPANNIKKLHKYLLLIKEELDYYLQHIDTANVSGLEEELKDIEKSLKDIAEIDPNVLVTVIEKEVITSKTAMFMNCWIDELQVDYIETNFSDRLLNHPFPSGGVRNFIRIWEETNRYMTQTLSATEVEDFKTPSGLQIYWTAIAGDQAYKYFTITDPYTLNPNIEDAGAFKVKVRKVLTEYTKLEICFNEVTLSNGGTTVSPGMIWGTGTDTMGLTNKGKGYVYKDEVGLVIKQINEYNQGFSGLRLNCVTEAVEIWNKLLNVWVPINMGKTATFGAGNVVFHADKTELTAEDLIGVDSLHVGYNSEVPTIETDKSKLFTSGLVLLGVEKGEGTLGDVVIEGIPYEPIGKTYIIENGVPRLPWRVVSLTSKKIATFNDSGLYMSFYDDTYPNCGAMTTQKVKLDFATQIVLDCSSWIDWNNNMALSFVLTEERLADDEMWCEYLPNWDNYVNPGPNYTNPKIKYRFPLKRGPGDNGARAKIHLIGVSTIVGNYYMGIVPSTLLGAQNNYVEAEMQLVNMYIE